MTTKRNLQFVRQEAARGWSSSHCRMDIAWFPLDTQRCSLVFESWTMNSRQMNMTAMDPAVDDGKYKPSGEWDLTGEHYTHMQSTLWTEKNVAVHL